MGDRDSRGCESAQTREERDGEGDEDLAHGTLISSRAVGRSSPDVG
jgi:hypothetical protein